MNNWLTIRTVRRRHYSALCSDLNAKWTLNRPSGFPKSRAMDVLEEWMNPTSPQKPTLCTDGQTPGKSLKVKPAPLPKTRSMEILERWLLHLPLHRVLLHHSLIPEKKKKNTHNHQRNFLLHQPTFRKQAQWRCSNSGLIRLLQHYRTAIAIGLHGTHHHDHTHQSRRQQVILHKRKCWHRLLRSCLLPANARSSAATASPLSEPRLPSPPPLSLRLGTMDAACQTELTMQDLPNSTSTT
ncbi:hypothetical protein BJ742DRAFT_269773 [Cladochytrium replicatum]|nr:hypothetical protein BJ742DRAFT_269773 [Cladochytrium replicatum]